MTRINSQRLWFRCGLAAIATAVLALSGCGGGSTGSTGAAGPPGPGGIPATPTATALYMTINSVTVKPTVKDAGGNVTDGTTVDFTVTNENHQGFPAFTDTDGNLRFNIAKLIPGSNGDPSTWQNYIETGGTAMHGSQERYRGQASDVWGKLVNHNDGSYTYIFETDITNVTCPSPCTTADGSKSLDMTYAPTAVTRVGIQMGNSALPLVNATYDFIPSTGMPANPASDQIIVNTDNCNQCHSQLRAHGTRIDTKLCVTCHNPGSWVDSTTPVDFKVMIHKIHDAENLPSGNGYHVGNSDFSDVVFPQDIRNCTKCHNSGTAPQGDNWETTPSMAACGSCHDDVYFTATGTGIAHPGGPQSDNSTCVTCHDGVTAPTVAEAHTIPEKVARANYEFKIWKICGTDVGSKPMCAPGSNPTVTFSVCDPNASSPSHQYANSVLPDGKTGNCYNIRGDTGDPEFLTRANRTSRLALDFAWDTTDYNNDGGSGGAPSQAISVEPRTSAGITYNGDGTFTLDGSQTAPVVVIPGSASGTGAIGMEGHPALDDGTDTYPMEVPVDSQVAYFGITDSTPKPRRVVVDAATRCDNCHDVLSLHGGNRNNNTQICVLCHNPNDTDVSQRPKDAITKLPTTATADGKTEESIDFKRLIHGIHAGSAAKGGFRTNGLVIYGYGGSTNDFGDVHFPGILSKCDTCHVKVSGRVNGRTTTFDTYTLEDRTFDGGIPGGGNWEYPSQNGILGSTVNSYPDALADGSDFVAQLTDHADDLKWSPIAAACSACHDDALARSHMMGNGALIGSNTLQPVDPITGQTDGSMESALVGNVESCPACHGPGALADVAVVHH